MVERDDIRRELRDIGRRREEAIHAEAQLARRQAALEARLADLNADAHGDWAEREQAMRARLEGVYGSISSPADLSDAIHAWRLNIPSVSALWASLRPGRDHLRGDPEAPLVVIEYGDYQCAECAEAHELHAQVRPWLEDGRLCFAFRHFPLIDAHPLALRAARAAEAAGAQGRFWQMHDLLMNRVTDERAQEGGSVSASRQAIDVEGLARRAGLDAKRFRTDMEDPALLERILEDFREGLASGVNGTPTFYLDGRRVDAGAVEELYERIAAAATAE